MTRFFIILFYHIITKTYTTFTPKAQENKNFEPQPSGIIYFFVNLQRF